MRLGKHLPHTTDGIGRAGYDDLEQWAAAEHGVPLWNLTELHGTPTGGCTSLNPPFSAVFAHWHLSFSDCAPSRLIPNVPDGSETRGIGPGAECGRTTNALSEARKRPTQARQPDAVRPIKSAFLGLYPIWVVVLSFPPSSNTRRFGGFETSCIGWAWNTGVLRMDYRDMCTSDRRGT